MDEEEKLPSLGLQEAHRLGLLHRDSSCHTDLMPRRVRPELGPFLLKAGPPAVATQKFLSVSVTGTQWQQGSIPAFSSPPGPAPQQVWDLMQAHVAPHLQDPTAQARGPVPTCTQAASAVSYHLDYTRVTIWAQHRKHFYSL